MLVSMLAGCGGGDDGAKRSLEEDLALVQADLDAAQSELATTKETLATTEETLATTATDLATTQAELATTKMTLATTEETLTSTEEDLADANNDLEDTEAELAMTEAELTMAESERDTAEEQLTTARINLGIANANLTNAQANLMTAQTNLTAAENDLAEKTTELTTTQGELTTANANLTTARMDLATARADLMTAQGDLTAETTKLLTAKADLKTAQDTLATVRGTLTTTQTALNTARARVTTLEGELTTLRSQVTTLQNRVAALQGQVQTGNTNLQNQLSEAEQATVDARAGAYIDALTPGGGSTPPNEPNARTVTVRYPRGGRLMINPGGNFATGTGAPSISGFTARTYKRRVGVSGEQTVFLYTNIQAAGSRAFWKDHGLDDVADASNQADANPTPTAAAQYIVDTTDTTQASGVRVGGRFDGVSGTFTCEVAACMGDRTDANGNQLNLTGLVSLPVNGVRMFEGGTWTFKPDSITSGMPQDEDTEHLFFGIWVEEPNVASMAHDYEYIMGGGSSPFTEVMRDGLPSTASFRGGAVGKYVTRNQVGESAKIGTFTAAVNFTATFGDSPTLEGDITNFRDGSQSLAGWSVYLGNAMDEPAVFSGAAVTDGIAKALIGGVSADGQWDATLYGNINDDLGHDSTADPNPRDLTRYPLARYPVADLAGLVGNFDAATDNAAIAGAFGATPR